MCGIFGLVATPSCTIDASVLGDVLDNLLLLSETRGKDASGLMVVRPEGIDVLKLPARPRVLLKTKAYKSLVREALTRYRQGQHLVVAGHTRMVTNGSEDDGNNNQPVIKSDHVLLHNGIIVNDGDIWAANPDLTREYVVDSEAFAAILSKARGEGASFPQAMVRAFSQARGANTIAAIGRSDQVMMLGTSNGSLYYWTDPSHTVSIFSSERVILERTIDRLKLPTAADVHHLPVHYCLRLDLADASFTELSPAEAETIDQPAPPGITREVRLVKPTGFVAPILSRPASRDWKQLESLMQPDRAAVAALRRCTQCLLPETFPFIHFDHEGVCQFCREHKPRRLGDPETLHRMAQSMASTPERQDCLVPISGGRDSCYGLHYVKKELGLNPVAYTYDWGFVTDLARRNISRMCEQLEVEHILVAADIRTKRENVRRNIVAWFNRPSLGMIPLFMAGDKMFFHYASTIRRQMALGPIFFSMNWLEKTGFKTGFAGVNDTSASEKTYGLTNLNKAKIFAYYASEFLANPAYINRSIPDTAFGFMSYYIRGKDYCSLFDFIPWDQDVVERTILDQYGWETSPETSSTWRIGDGTAPFYNYIYYTVAGFTEYDTFRSNQIREGLLSRDEAASLVTVENSPRIEPFVWYCDMVGLDPVEVVRKINAIPRRYPRP